MTWDKHKKPPTDICPKQYCFHWAPPGSLVDMSRRLHNSIEEALAHRDGWVEVPDGGCVCRFGLCTRLDPVAGDHDWYSTCEPELERGGLPWFYFIPSVEEVDPESREEYLRESQALWGDGKEST